MDRDRGHQVVLCTPGFPASAHDVDKPFLLDHARALTNAGFIVTVVCPNIPGLPRRHQVDGIDVIRVRYAPRRFETLAATGSMYREARGFRALFVIPMVVSMILATIKQLRRGTQLAYGHWWMPGGLVATVSARLTRTRSLVHLHGSDVEISQRKPMRVLARLVLRFADGRLAASDELASWGRQTSSLEVSVLPMPIDHDRLPTVSPVSEDGFVLGVGRLVHEKGFDVLIEALGQLAPTRRPQVTIVGVGPERQALLDRAVRLGVDLHLPGAVPPSEIGEWYRRARIVAVPSRREGFGLVAAEAAAAGRAVVCTRVGGHSTVVEDGVSGVLVEPDDAAELARAIDEISPSRGLNGPRQVKALSIEAHGRSLRQLYDDLLTDSR